MYVEDLLEAEVLYKLIESLHTSILPLSLLEDENVFIIFLSLSDKYGLESIMDRLMELITVTDDVSDNMKFSKLSLNVAIIESFQQSYSPHLQKFVKKAYETCFQLQIYFILNKELAQLKERFIDILVSLFSPLDNFLDDKRLLSLPAIIFQELIKDDRLLATNEAVICWCCIKFSSFNGLSNVEDIHEILKLVRFNIMSPLSLLFFTEFGVAGPVINQNIVKYLEKTTKITLFNKSLPDWFIQESLIPSNESIQPINSHSRGKLSDLQLKELYTMDFTTKIPDAALLLLDDVTTYINLCPEKEHYRGGWKWSLIVQRHSVVGAELGNVGIYVQVHPIIGQSTTKVRGSSQIYIYCQDTNNWEEIIDLGVEIYTNKGRGKNKFDTSINGSTLKWSMLRGSKFLDSSNILRLRLVIDPYSVCC